MAWHGRLGAYGNGNITYIGASMDRQYGTVGVSTRYRYTHETCVPMYSRHNIDVGTIHNTSSKRAPKTQHTHTHTHIVQSIRPSILHSLTQDFSLVMYV